MAAAAADRVQVAVRLRPLLKKEAAHSTHAWEVEGGSVRQSGDSKGASHFAFEHVYSEEQDTAAVYEGAVAEVVQSALEGFNGTAFAYGQTASGKTHTMMGTPEEAGIVQLAARQIMEHIAGDAGRIFLVRCSYLELYNEELRDILQEGCPPVRLRIHPKTGVFVHGAAWQRVLGVEDIVGAVQAGNARRAVGATDMNARSSRSHTILTIEVSSTLAEDVDGTGGALQARVNLVDLAGSESVRLTGAEGARLKEGAAINKSLLTLSRIINLVSRGGAGGGGGAFIPFRESKLTHLLEPSLSGRAKTAVICCISPASKYVEESRSTLQFATSAKAITTHATRNEVVDDSTRIARLSREIAQLKAALAAAQASDSASDGAPVPDAAAAAERQARLATLLQEFIIGGGGEAGQGGTGAAGTARGRSVLGVARLNRKGRGRKARETWCPSMAASSGALEAIEAFRAPAGAGPSPLGSPAAASGGRPSTGGHSTASRISERSESSACTEDEGASLQLELHKARTALAAAQAELAAAHGEVDDLVTAGDEREEALEAALARAEAAEAAASQAAQQVDAASAAAAATAVREEAAVRALAALQSERTAAAGQAQAASTALQLQLADASSALAAAQDALAAERARCERLEKVKVTQELVGTLRGLKSDRRALRKQVAALQAALAEQGAAGDGAAAAAAAESVAALQQAVGDKEEQLAATEAELSEATAAAARQRKVAEAATTRAEAAEEETSSLRGQLHEVVSLLAGAKAAVCTVADLGLDAEALGPCARAEDAAGAVQGMSRLLQHLAERVRAAEAAAEESTARVVRLAGQVKAGDAAAAAAAADAAAARGETAEAQAAAAELAPLRAQVLAAGEDVARLQGSLQAAEEQAAAASRMCEAAQAAAAESAARCEAAEQAAADATAGLATAQAEAQRNAEFLEKENLQLMMELRSVRKAAATEGGATAPPTAPLAAVSDNTTPAAHKGVPLPPAVPAGALPAGEEDEAGECKQQ